MKQRKAKAIKLLKDVCVRETDHRVKQKRLRQLIQSASIVNMPGALSPSERAKAAGQEISNLKGTSLENIRQLITLNKARKDGLDAAIREARAIASTSSGYPQDVREALGNAMRETKELQHEITLHQALLQMRSWMAALSSEVEHSSSNVSSSNLASVTKTQDDWSKKIIEMLKSVPGSYPLGFQISGAINARELLWLALDKYAITADHRMEVFVHNFEKSKVRSEEWPTMGPKPLREDASSQNNDSQGNLEANIHESRDAIAFLDGKVYHSELFAAIYKELDIKTDAATALRFKQRAKVEQIEADSLALQYGHSFIEAQSHFPASIARSLTINQELTYHLIYKVTPNLYALSGQLKNALAQVPSNDPLALIETMSSRAIQKLKGQKVSWELPRRPTESQEEYRMLRHCLPSFLKAADHLRLLAIRVKREAKGKDKGRAVDSLQRLADDFRVVAKQISTYMGELTNFGVSPENLGESEASMAVAKKLQGIDWTQSQLLADEKDEVPDKNDVTVPTSDMRNRAELVEEEKDRPDQVKTSSMTKGQERLERKFVQLGELAAQQLDLSQEILNRLRAGDTSRNVSAGQVEITLKSALKYKKQQLTLLKEDHTLEQGIRTLETVMWDRIAEAISLRPTQQAVKNAIEQGMSVTVKRPIILDVTRENDFVHEYLFAIGKFEFKLHAHYETQRVAPNQAPQKIHFKRLDERGTDDEGRSVYYLDDRQVRTAFRSREAKEGIAIAQSFLKEEEWMPVELPIRSR